MSDFREPIAEAATDGPASRDASGERRGYALLQVGRGIAALLVVVYHAVIIMGLPEYGGHVARFAPPPVGWIGVNFFFVLSGFIIVHAHARDIGRPDRLARYAWRRFSRVYPVYWLFLTLFILAAAAGLGHPDFSWNPANLATAYTLVAFDPLPSLPLKVAWTLLYEVEFYAIFAIFILNRRIGTVAFAVWLVAIVASALRHHGIDDGFPEIWSANFFIGMGAWWLTRGDRLRRAGPALLAAGLAGLVALVVAGAIPDGPFPAQNRPLLMLALGLAFGAVLAGSVLIERTRALRVPAALILLGDASYVLYLVHSAVISQAMAIHQRLALGIAPDALLVLLIVGATAGGIVAHILIERPLLALTRRLGPASNPTPSSMSGATR